MVFRYNLYLSSLKFLYSSCLYEKIYIFPTCLVYDKLSLIWEDAKCVHVYGRRYLTNWYGLVYTEGACRARLDVSAWRCRWCDTLCVCSVVAADTGWHNQVTETVKAQGYRLCSRPSYWRTLFGLILLKHPPPFWALSPTLLLLLTLKWY